MAGNFEILLKASLDKSDVLKDIESLRKTANLKPIELKVNITGEGASLIQQQIKQIQSVATVPIKFEGIGIKEVESSTSNISKEIERAEGRAKEYAQSLKGVTGELTRIGEANLKYSDDKILSQINYQYKDQLGNIVNINQVLGEQEKIIGNIADKSKQRDAASARSHQQEIEYLAKQRTEQEKILKQKEDADREAVARSKTSGMLSQEEKRKQELYWVERLNKEEKEIINTLERQKKSYRDILLEQEGAQNRARIASERANEELEKTQARVRNLTMSSQNRAIIEEKIANIMKMQDPSQQVKALKVLNTEITAMGKNARGMGDDLKTAYEKFAVWSVATVTWYGIIRAVKDMVNQVKELDTALVELQKVTDLSGNSLKQYQEDAFKVAETVGRTGKEVIDAATVFARSGYEAQEALNLSEVALVMTNVGDGINGVEEAATSLISVMKAYNISANDSVKITDLINEVSNNAAINFADLTEGIRRAGAVYAQSGTSIEELAGLLTGTNEIMQNIEKSSAGLITVSQRKDHKIFCGEGAYVQKCA